MTADVILRSFDKTMNNTFIAKILPEEIILNLIKASMEGDRLSDERAAAIDRVTVIAKYKYPKLFKTETPQFNRKAKN